MGRQVNFFLSYDDQAELADKLDHMGTVLAAAEFSDVPQVTPLPVSTFARWIVGLSPPLLFHPQDLGRLIIESSRLTVPDFGIRYYIERTKNPIVEFSTCIQRDKEIQRGRFYYEPRYFDNGTGTMVEKSPEFIAWATKIFNLVKKITAKDAQGYYIGRDAQALQSQGHTFLHW
jgi:hypothetical protein